MLLLSQNISYIGSPFDSTWIYLEVLRLPASTKEFVT